MSKLSLLIPLIFVLSACGGNHFDQSHLTDKGPVPPAFGCTADALTALNDLTDLCGRDLSEDVDKDLCLTRAAAYQQKYPDVVCNLEGETIVTAQLIDEAVEAIEDEDQTLIDSGIFDE
ncbi:MAG: hypothetical protein ACRBBP_04115 [Bdellovibrionales bacterium]